MASKKLSSFSLILQSEFLTTDCRWEYQVPDLPTAQITNPDRWIKSLELVSNAQTRKLELRFIKTVPNRATGSCPSDRLLHLSFPDFRLGQFDEEGKWQTFTARETADYLVRLLKEGITLNCEAYSFYGHSFSQLKSRSCYLLRGSKHEVAAIVESLGDFSKITTVAKKAKRIGLLFSSCNATMDVSDARYEDIDDIERDGYNFTDGCGEIGPNAAKLLSQKLSIISRNTRYHPSVFQIRFKGYKGVVSLEPKMPEEYWFRFRHSMRKFSGSADQSFAVVEHSKPYTYGYLNDDIVLLLSALGISTVVLLQKQVAHFDRLRQSLTNPATAFSFLCSLDRFDLAEKLVLQGFGQVSSSLRSLVSAEYKKTLNKRDTQKCRILVPESRLVFGICDNRELLKEGECFLRVTDDRNGRPITISDIEVLVTRNPCLHPGDLRKLRAVDRPELAHLTDCVVFSVKGGRPAADQMSGGDLDGDTFFVCWDPDLVPSRLSEAAQYPPGKQPVSFGKITTDDRIEFFARYTSISLGRVKNLFLEWAMRNEDGALSSECQELNQLHSLCVDGNRIKIDDRFTKLPPLKEGASQSFVLNVLHEAAEKECQQRVAAQGSWEMFDSRELIETILCQPRSCSEFRMVELVYDWCRRNREAELAEFLPYFDLGALTVEQQHWLLQELPTATDLPALVMNGLLSSNILQPHELSPFHLDYPSMRWKRIFGVENRLGNLFEVLEKTFPQFARKLLVLRINERFSIAIYIPQRMAIHEEALVGTRVLVFAFPHTLSYTNARDRIHCTTAEYRLHFNHTTLQLYNRQRQDTFIWIGQPGINDASFRQNKGKANRARQRHQTVVEGTNHEWVASIALNRISRSLQTHIGAVRRHGIAAVELYIIGNTDVHSFQTLDLWLQSIDTLETTPLFGKVPPPLVIPQMSTADWSSQTDEVRALVIKGDLSQLDQLPMQSNIVPVFQFCYHYAEANLPGRIYCHYLESASAVSKWLAPKELLDGLLQGLLYAPGNVIFFARLCPWEQNLPDNLRRSLKSHIPYLLQSLLQSARYIGEFAIEAFCKLGREADTLSPLSFKNLVEKASLVLNSPALLLDFCLECFQPMGERLLTESSSAKQYFSRHLFAAAIDHNEEACEAKPPRNDLWAFESVALSLTYPVLTSNRRIDAPQLERLAAGDHVRFELARFPENVLLPDLASFDALVQTSQPGTVTFACLSYPPAYLASARWRMKHCGSFVTAEAMFDALVELVEQKENACALYPLLANGRWDPKPQREGVHYRAREDLNECQNQAVKASLNTCLTCVWGPPGTGKTQTVAVILQEFLRKGPEERILVTAPTHNAVDNILRRYLAFTGFSGVKPLRVTTNIRKVSSDLVQYTCDGMDMNDSHSASKARRLALERIRQARLVFTTCAGAGLGLLRKEGFQVVLIDESSQQSEPMSLIPLTKGCQRAILVGDHVQLRSTVGKYAKMMGLEISLFERLYTSDEASSGAFSKVMLDIQYRMHPQIGEFPSREFYSGRLKADISCDNRPLHSGCFPWPRERNTPDTPLARRVFVACYATEDAGHQSKGNPSQAELCKKIHRLLTSPKSDSSTSTAPPSIAVLTPYTRQVKMLQSSLPSSATVSSIDGFQGREADIVIYVTVRCNPHGEIGFLSDLRRLNVVLTRARAGLIVVGCPRTLTHGGPGDPGDGTVGQNDLEVRDNDRAPDGCSGFSGAVDQDSRPVWRRLVASLVKVELS
ncbi:RNA dependent RNA polymerase-domain-containing protein [Aspergillus undulatus]|uniref:RNA dependent RNA polymerase-domain-containing protein n=1 Tax=Aspergillus undulatus TaxID=1810928 RepID=UPI003CCCFB12